MNILGLQGIVKNAAIFPSLHIRSALTTIYSRDFARFGHDSPSALPHLDAMF
jgi:hypothetical protein